MSVGGVAAYHRLVSRLVPEGSGRRRAFLPGVVGAVASCLILLGASQSTSPYAFKKLPYAWFFGDPSSTPGPPSFIGVFAVLGGMVLLVFAWFWLLQVRLRAKDSSLRHLGVIFAGWVLPMLVVAPILSRDVYTYAAQGEMMSHHISPYAYGPGVMGSGISFTNLTDPIWQQSPSPYGPLFLRLDGWIVSASGHSVLWSVVLLRLLALLGVLLATVGVAMIARHFQRDPVLAVLLVAFNPLVLLHLVGGAHNDALMVGLLVLGIALAVEKHPILGTVMCALAASVKAPAALAIVFIGWTWLDGRVDARPRRLFGVAVTGTIGLGIMAAFSELTGLGWGWTKGLSNPGVARTWLDAPTGLGMLLGRLFALVGLHGMTTDSITLVRDLGMLAAGLIILYLLVHCDRVGLVRAIGLSLLAVAILGPVVQPWYLTWGLIVLAPIASSRTLAAIVSGSAFASFVGVPIGAVVVGELQGFDPWLRIGTILVVALIVVGLIRACRTLGVRSFPVGEIAKEKVRNRTGERQAIQPQTARL